MNPKLDLKKGSFTILDFVDNNPECSLAAITKDVGMSPHTVHNRLGVLQKNGWIKKNLKNRMNNTCEYSVTPSGHDAACLIRDLERTLEVSE